MKILLKLNNPSKTITPYINEFPYAIIVDSINALHEQYCMAIIYNTKDNFRVNHGKGIIAYLDGIVLDNIFEYDAYLINNPL